jgi:hypothetical protein
VPRWELGVGFLSGPGPAPRTPLSRHPTRPAPAALDDQKMTWFAWHRSAALEAQWSLTRFPRSWTFTRCRAVLTERLASTPSYAWGWDYDSGASEWPGCCGSPAGLGSAATPAVSAASVRPGTA